MASNTEKTELEIDSLKNELKAIKKEVRSSHNGLLVVMIICFLGGAGMIYYALDLIAAILEVIMHECGKNV